MGRSPREFVDNYYAKLAESIFDNRKKGLKGSIDIKFRRKDGSEMWARISSSPRFTDGIFDGVLEMLTDVTDDKRTALKIAWLASFPESSPDPIIEINRYGRISYSNQIANNLFPDLRTAGLGHPFLAEINTIFAQLHKRGDTVASRELWVGASCYEQVFSYHIEADILRIYGRDVTRRRQVEEELKSAKAQAELYVDLMGHDINNMNQTAIGYLELALQELETEKKLRMDDKALLEKPMQSLANSSALIDNVRKLQKLMMQDIKTKPIDLQNILREVEGTSFHSDDRDVTINIQHVSGYSVEANELLKDVFVNLISNAVKHSDREKPLTVNVKVEAVNENDHKYYRCMVEDNGPGIPDEMKNKLFNRFQRGTTQAHGKGLGLYLVRTLVDGFHGIVWVEDRVPGDYTKGARFVIMLPSV
jgi:signal transduction histidine kinase